MKHLKWALGVLLLAIVPVLAWVGVARAQHIATSVDKGQTIYSSVYSAGKNIDIQGVIYGDVFCLGQNVKINAEVHGDVICAGQDVTVDGKIDGNVRVAGQMVTLKGEISKNATVAGMTFSLDAEAKVGQDLTATGDSFNVKGSVGRDVVASGNTVILNSTIGRNVKAHGSNIELKDQTRITGDFNYSSAKDAKVDQSAQVSGKTQHDVPQKKGGGFNFPVYLLAVFGLTLFVVTLAFLFPRFLRKTSDNLLNSFPRALLVGFVASFLVPALCIGLFVSFIGIPMALIVLLTAVFAAALSGPITAYYIGRLVFSKSKNKDPLLLAVAGGFILVTSYFIPLIGIVCLIGAYWVGFGALLMSLKEHVRPLGGKA